MHVRNHNMVQMNIYVSTCNNRLISNAIFFIQFPLDKYNREGTFEKNTLEIKKRVGDAQLSDSISTALNLLRRRTTAITKTFTYLCLSSK